MAKLGIVTTPPIGTPLPDGGGNINSNFDELYNLLGDGNNLVDNVVTEIIAGENISISTSYGNVSIAVSTNAFTETLDTVTSRGNITANGIRVGVATATSFVKTGGTSSQFLKADGSIDNNTYLTSASSINLNLDDVTTNGSKTNNNIEVGSIVALGNISAGSSILATNSAIASSFRRINGLSTEFLKGDGSVDVNNYATVNYVDQEISKVSGGSTSGGGSGIGSVISVNGQTGDVSLGIQDMDDFELNYEPDPNAWTATFTISSHSTGSCQTAGNIAPNEEGSENGAIISRFDSDGDNIESDFLAAANGGTLYLRANGGTEVAITIGNVFVYTGCSPAGTHRSIFVGNNTLRTTIENTPIGGTITISSEVTRDVSLAEGDILQWNDTDKKFNPAQVGDIVGAVTSVNGETGAVSLGIQDMDDFELNPNDNPEIGLYNVYRSNANDLQEYNGAATIQFGSATTPLGEKRFGETDANGVNRRSEYELLNNGSIWASINDLPFQEVPANWQTMFGGYLDVDLTNDNAPAGTVVTQVRLALIDPGGPIPLAEGDILQWNDADQKFKPTQVIISGDVRADTLTVSGVSTFSGNIDIDNTNILFDESTGVTNNRIKFGPDAYIYKHSGIASALTVEGTDVQMNASSFTFLSKQTSLQYLGAYSGRVELYFSGNKKLETSSSGIDVIGTVDVSNLVNTEHFVGAAGTFTNDLHFTKNRSNSVGNGSLNFEPQNSATSWSVRVDTADNLNFDAYVGNYSEVIWFEPDGGAYFSGTVGVATCINPIDAANKKYVDTQVGLSTVGLASVAYVDQQIAGAGAVGGGSTTEWILGAEGSNNYTFDGPGFSGPTPDPTLYLVRGQSYRFTNNMNAHPFRIQSTQGTSGTVYNDGITNNSVSNGTLVWDVQFDSPKILYYQCTAHSNMQGQINIIGENEDSPSYTDLDVSDLFTLPEGRIETNSNSNLRFGYSAIGGNSNIRNIAIGDQVLSNLSNTGNDRNICIGELSYYNTTNGKYNIGIGIQAGEYITSGSYNVIIGTYDGKTGLDLRTSSNNVVIADGEGNIRQYINSAGNVGIKTTILKEALNVSGIVSATGFYGQINAGQLTGALPALDGSALTGVSAVGSGIEVRDNGVVVGAAATVDFSSGLDVSPVSAGVVTITADIPGISTTGSSVFEDIDVADRASIGTCVVESGADITGYTTFRSGPNTKDRIALIGASVDGSSRPGLMIGNTDSSDTTEYTFKMGRGNQGSFRWKNNNGLTADTITFYHTGTYYIRPGGVNSQFRIVNKYHSTNPTLTSGDNIVLFWANSGGTSFSRLETTSDGVTVYGDLTLSGSGSQFVGSGAGLTSIPSGELTGALPAIDGSALLNVNATGDGVVVENSGSNVGSAKTINFDTGLDVTYSSGIATVTSSGGSLRSRTVVSGSTPLIADNEIGNINIQGFKSYNLMKVGLSTAGWLRIYTDNASRSADTYRSVGEDPLPGSGVIAEVITTGITTTQIMSPFVPGGNMDTIPSDTVYVSVKNMSGQPNTISVDLTLLQLEV